MTQIWPNSLIKRLAHERTFSSSDAQNIGMLPGREIKALPKRSYLDTLRHHVGRSGFAALATKRVYLGNV
ncbi:unnamed protein product [Ranitomeya imitator]|uniref:Uncharacterized protein n=1 Tax=Ranitomeya imitator TaxID=111125 RepID=A0ABN9LSE1_9NEOB|nr:unnamed protein product [Ranitomeya imitator]